MIEANITDQQMVFLTHAAHPQKVLVTFFTEVVGHAVTVRACVQRGRLMREPHDPKWSNRPTFEEVLNCINIFGSLT